MQALGHGILMAIDSEIYRWVNIVEIVREQGVVNERPWETLAFGDSWKCQAELVQRSGM